MGTGSYKEKRKYFVATHDEPIKHTISRTSLGQVHKLSTNGVKNDENYFVLSGKRETVLKSDSKDSPAYYRIFEKIPAHPLVSDFQSQPIIKVPHHGRSATNCRF